MEQCSECQGFFEKQHPNITGTDKVLNLMNNNVSLEAYEVQEKTSDLKQIFLGGSKVPL